MSYYLVVPDSFCKIEGKHLYHLLLETTEASLYLDEDGILMEKYKNNILENIESNQVLESLLFFLSIKNKSFKKLKNVNSSNLDKPRDFIDLLIRTTLKRNLIVCDESNFIDEFHLISSTGINLIEYSSIESCIDEKVKEEDFDFVKQTLLEGLCKLVEQKVFMDFEDLYNTLIVNSLNLNLLSNVFDQTLIGKSGATMAKKQGEIDAYVRKPNGIPCTIIEAMITKSFTNKNSKIAEHLKKLLIDYNPVGIRKNIFLVFYKSDNFLIGWQRYIKYLNNLNQHIVFSPLLNECKLIDIINDEDKFCNDFTNIKLIKTIHEYKGENYELTHFFINLFS